MNQRSPVPKALLTITTILVLASGCEKSATFDVDKALNRIDSGAQDQVIADLEHLSSEEKSNNSDVQFILGYIREKEGILDSALWHYDRAFNIGASDERPVLFAQARVHYELGEFSEAFNTLSIIERKDSCYRAVRYYQALALNAEGMEAAAAGRCLAQLRCNQQDTLALSKLAALELDMGNYDSALKHVHTRLSLHPSSIDSQVLARVLAHKGEDVQALFVLDSALVRYGPSTGLLSTRAAILGDLSRIQEMRRDLLAAIMLDSLDVETRSLIQMAFNSGHIDRTDVLHRFVRRQE